jgi:two-component system, sensor histidine kinase
MRPGSQPQQDDDDQQTVRITTGRERYFKEPPRERWRMWTPYLVLATGFIITAVATSLVQRQVTRDERQRFEQDTDQLLVALKNRLDEFQDALHAVSGLFAASGEIDARRFGEFVAHLRLGRHPGLRALAYAEPLERDGLEAVIERMHEEGFGGFSVWPESQRTWLRPILWAAPLTGTNRAALGFDLSSHDRTEQAFVRACQLGGMSMTPSIDLPASAPSDGRTGFLMIMPLVPDSDGQGCQDLRGHAFAMLASGAFFQSVADELPEGQLRFSIRSKSTGEVLFGPRGPGPRFAPFSGERTLEVGGRTWIVTTWPGTAFDLLSPRTLVPAALITGILVSFLLFGLVWSESQARDRAERAARELYQSEDALQRTNQAKDEFLAMLGHELRNPLSAVKMALDILRSTNIDDPDAKAALDVADRQMRHQTRLVDDLLDVARVSRGKVALKPERLDLRDVVANAVTGVERSEQGRGYGLTVDRPAEPVCVNGDPTRLEQVVSNLLLNAIKYSPEGGSVRVSITVEGDQAVVSVRDEGVGIDAAQLDRIFDLFAQVDTSLDRSAGGLGIGLTLVKRLVELHGGSVLARSEGAGKGSEFVVSLPMANDTSEPAGADADAQPQRAPRLRILLIEDNADARLMLRSLLERQGHHVETASDGESGVKAALEGDPDVALVDIGLPAMDGYEVARQLRKARGAQTPMLLSISGYGQPADHERSREAGFLRHLVKPVDPQALGDLLADLQPRESQRSPAPTSRGR